MVWKLSNFDRKYVCNVCNGVIKGSWYSGVKFETFQNKVILLKVDADANGFRNIIWILLKPLLHQYE